MVNSIKSDLLIALAEYYLGPLTHCYLRKLPDFVHWREGRKKRKTSGLTSTAVLISGRKKKYVLLY